MSADADGEDDPLDSFQFEFSSIVDSDTTEGDDFTVEREVPYDGRIRTFVVGWPAGANNLVGVQLRNRDTDDKLFPFDDQSNFIGANAFTHPFDLDVHVSEEDVLIVQFVNNDTQNDHFVNAIVTIEADPGADVGLGEAGAAEEE